MTTIYDIPAKRLDGSPASLRPFEGKVVLVVNVASKCGLTPQYESLQRLYEAKKNEGLVIVGFPCNDFGAQEPGSPDEIAAFCSTNYDVGFPLFEKVAVKGEAQHPVYASLIEAQPRAQEKAGSDFRAKLEGYGIKQERPEDVLWNFEKFLIARDGRVAGRFAPDVSVDEEPLAGAIARELAS
jgi:glutathione peroxidase